jgi:hypothetical protein
LEVDGRAKESRVLAHALICLAPDESRSSKEEHAQSCVQEHREAISEAHQRTPSRKPSQLELGTLLLRESNLVALAHAVPANVHGRCTRVQPDVKPARSTRGGPLDVLSVHE